MSTAEVVKGGGAAAGEKERSTAGVVKVGEAAAGGRRR